MPAKFEVRVFSRFGAIKQLCTIVVCTIVVHNTLDTISTLATFGTLVTFSTLRLISCGDAQL